MPKITDLVTIKTLTFPEDQYYKEVYPKKQIVLHHTASGRGIDGDFKHWLNTPERIATCVIIDAEGVVFQLFSSKYWGHHLGVKLDTFSKMKTTNQSNMLLNRQAIAVEIDNWGGLTKKEGKWYSYTNTLVHDENVVEYPQGYRDFFAFEKYTAKQIETTKQLILYWADLYKIPLNYNEDMWDVSAKALEGTAGIFTHNSYRSDKSDLHPQAEMIEMLKSLC